LITKSSQAQSYNQDEEMKALWDCVVKNSL